MSLWDLWSISSCFVCATNTIPSVYFVPATVSATVFWKACMFTCLVRSFIKNTEI